MRLNLYRQKNAAISEAKSHLAVDREKILQAAQKQLEEIVQRQPANRKARVLLINYWKETGQLQNVQILLAQLEQRPKYH